MKIELRVVVGFCILCCFWSLPLIGQDYEAELLFFTEDGTENGTSLFPGFRHHSCWSGIGAASNGMIYIAVSNHRRPTSASDVHGNVAIYKYDPIQEKMSLLGDLKSVSQEVDNWMENESLYKVHSFLTENEDGKIYFAGHEHPPAHFLRGTHFYTIDTQNDHIEDLSKTFPKVMLRDHSVIDNHATATTTSGISIEYNGVKGIGLNPNAPDYLYAVSYPDEDLIQFNMKNGDITLVENIAGIEKAGNTYVIIVDNDGNVFYCKKNDRSYDFKKYNRTTQQITTLALRFNPRAMGAIAPTSDWDVFYLVTQDGEFYKLTPAQDKLEFLRHRCNSFWWQMYNLSLSPNDRYLYNVITQGPVRSIGIYRIDLKTNLCVQIKNLNSLVDGRILCFGGINVWDKIGHLYLPIYRHQGDTRLAVLKIKIPEAYK